MRAKAKVELGAQPDMHTGTPRYRLSCVSNRVGPPCAGPPQGCPGPTQGVQIQAPRGEVSLWICVGPHCAFLRKIMGWKEESLVGRSLSLGYQHVRAPTHWPLKAPHHYL